MEGVSVLYHLPIITGLPGLLAYLCTHPREDSVCMYELSDVCLQPVPLNQVTPQITLLGAGL